MGLEADKNDIDELLEEHSQELTAEDLKELRCVSQQEDVEESLSEKEEISGSHILQDFKLSADLFAKAFIIFSISMICKTPRSVDMIAKPTNYSLLGDAVVF
ncbi:hypothetical protein AVEN_97421-1 [Araneus ventricosus]|uniref:Uncharacterized protein n=1 Tax=Araneus ventricosus TaxID=182803 RepID=A0A4Y2EJ17_ARAVE|nr:hypothetical protein AVEN_97421-1 [Araneus ventricosus]